MTSSPLLTCDAEFSVFIRPIDHVGYASRLGVTCSGHCGPAPKRPSRGRQHQQRPRRECRRAACGPAQVFESTGTI